jgi:hypothetical protein
MLQKRVLYFNYKLKKHTHEEKMLALQTEFCPALPNIYGSKDFKDYRQQLSDIDHHHLW